MDQWNQKIVHVVRQDVIEHCVNNFEWQMFRLDTLKGISTYDKLANLSKWLHGHNNAYAAQCQVNNYLGALKRGGQISADGKVLK